MTQLYGVGIIGAGVIFAQHMRALEALSSRARVIGLADTDQAKRRQATDQHFIPTVVEDYHELLRRDDIDIIIVCAPPVAHEQMVTDALEAGKYVICEKPLAPTLAAADRIIAAAESNGDRLSTVYQLRWSTAVQRMRLLTDEGYPGQWLLARASRLGRLTGSLAANVEGWGQWAVAGGGVVMTRFIHELDLLVYLLGQPTHVDAWMDTMKNPIESEDTCGATITFENGARATVFCTMVAHTGNQTEFEVIGQDLAMQMPWRLASNDPHTAERAKRRASRAVPIDRRTTRLARVIRKGRSAAGRFVPALKPPPFPSPHEPFVKSVLDAIDRGDPMPVDAGEARRSLELCTAMYTSALTGEIVSLPLDANCPYYEGISTDNYDGKARRARRMSQAESREPAPTTPVS